MGIRAVELQPDFKTTQICDGNFKGHLDGHKMFEYTLYLRHDTRKVHSRPKGVLEQAGGAEQHNITQAAPNELKLGADG